MIVRYSINTMIWILTVVGFNTMCQIFIGCGGYYHIVEIINNIWKTLTSCGGYSKYDLYISPFGEYLHYMNADFLKAILISRQNIQPKKNVHENVPERP